MALRDHRARNDTTGLHVVLVHYKQNEEAQRAMAPSLRKEPTQTVLGLQNWLKLAQGFNDQPVAETSGELPRSKNRCSRNMGMPEAGTVQNRYQSSGL